MSKVIAIINQKGGVGKTTTAVNLSSCLAYKGKKTLLIDSDSQGSSTSGYGVDKNSAKYTLYDCIADNSILPEAIIETKYRDLFLIPSNPSLSAAEIELAFEDEREYFIKKMLANIKDDYDFVIIDSPPSLGMMTLNILTACDSIMIPIQCEYYALEGLAQLMSTLRSVKKKLNPDIQIEGVVATMFDARTNLSIQVLDEIKKFFPDKVYKTIIPRNVRLSEAPSFGEPIIKYDITSKGAEAYLSLAREVISQNS